VVSNPFEGVGFISKKNQNALVAHINKNPIIMGIRPNNIFIECLLVKSFIF